MFILIAENKASLLTTIISRCVTLTLTTPEFSLGLGHLKSTTKFEAHLIEDALKSEKNNVGRALNLLNGKASSKTEAAALKFIEYAIDGDMYSMQRTVLTLSKSRVEASAFIKDLKYLLAQRIRKSPQSHLAKPLLAIYNIIPEFEDSLATNINLNLLFCNLCCKMTEIIRRNK
jgi:hypothetical protein